MSVRQPPRLHVAPKASRTYGDLAADLAGDYGLRPDDWQQVILDDWLAETRGRWASLTCGLSVARQNGKNGALEVRELFGMVGRGEKILHTAHQVKTAQKHFRRLKYFFGRKAMDPAARFPELNALVSEIRNVNGQEAIFLRNGGSVEIVARSQGSGRGFTVDVIVCDEAQDMSDDDLEALLSTSSAAPSGNPQWIFTGTPPGPRANGEVFTRIRGEALTGKGKRICWHEWSCVAPVDLDSREEWAAANPALGTRLQLDVVTGERANLSDEGFARERLGMWASASSLAAIDAARWARLAVPASPAGRPVYAFDMDPGRERLTVAVAVRADERIHVEVAERRPPGPWLAAWFAPRAARGMRVLVDQYSPALSLVPDLEAAGVEVTIGRTRDMVQACGAFLDAVNDGSLTHFDQPSLNAAVAGARRRAIGADGGFGWDRRGDADISPLVAVTLAAHGLRTAKRERSSVAVFA